MESQFCTFLVFLMTMHCVSYVFADCFKMSGCMNPKADGKRKSDDIFSIVDSVRVSCSTCKCVKNKQYVASCMVVSVVDIAQPTKKAGLRKRIVDANKERMTATFATEEEVELTEEESISVQCEPETVPAYDKERKILQFKFINYFFTTRETYCCSTTPAYGDVHPYCKVQFDSKCRAKAVLRDHPRRRCPMPLGEDLRG